MSDMADWVNDLSDVEGDEERCYVTVRMGKDDVRAVTVDDVEDAIRDLRRNHLNERNCMLAKMVEEWLKSQPRLNQDEVMDL